ncbi:MULTISPECIES: META domain-containing protein [Helicobacter]|uniref:Outer membrane protein n=2 Tax=Helicobacter TaxID=209 RepID=A0A377J633_9HELI|nr:MULTISPECIES: META domain-containing protein [Helicobacter]MDL0080007.1 META domain-containing protein [Helicobacter sp. CPD2-1]MDL0081794.1 META domain-containing protein [Helicobacter sp. XJK30-2]STO97910.1 outer membrane protein [Helicobacter canis]
MRVCKVLWVLLFGLMCSVLNASESLLGVSAYTLGKVGRFEVEFMQLGEYEIAVPYEIENAFLLFSSSQVSGIVGCNNFFAPYQVQGGGKVLVVGAGGLSKKMCAKALESNLEAIFARNFNGRFIVQGNDEYIELVGESGFRIRLVPSLSLEP